HNGFVQINQEKMSKSLGNFFTIREIFEKSEWSEEVTGEILRYFLLSTHYHGPLDFSDQALKEAKNALNGFYDLFGRLAEPGVGTVPNPSLMERIQCSRGGFTTAMDDDLNTPVAIAVLQGLRSDVNKMIDKGLSTEGRKKARQEFRSLGQILGLFQADTWQFGSAVAETLPINNDGTGNVRFVPNETDIEKMLMERREARSRKDFKRADEIRKSLAAQGVIIEDKPDGTTRWKR
ncbi:MAG: cysteine--tRNA ligase, partial [Nitrospira sp.]|nr:cysteine--tRNA ligase [Nitrospira sp.]